MAIKDALRLAFNKGYVQLGDNRAEIPKLTYAKYKKLDGILNQIPGLTFTLMMTPKEQYFETALAAFDIALEEAYDVVAALSDTDADYLKENAGITEVIDYIVLTAKKNNFAETVKNVRSLLPEQTNEPK
jgi:hypothetical protein